MKQAIAGLAVCMALGVWIPWAAAAAGGGTFAKLEARFEIPQLQGNPFDFAQNDVQVKISTPSGELVVPAFFDGGVAWRVRFCATEMGNYQIKSITLNGVDANPQNLDHRGFDVTGESRPGFVRIDPANAMRFIFDDGSPYYPLGYDLGWRSEGMKPLTHSLGLMGQAGVNWTRIWMCYWDGKNLGWGEHPNVQPKLGTLSLPVARLWDDIVAAADANAVHFQMVLQHHGEYSSKTNPNWPENPWNKANGGWLENPVQFFTDAKAKALTKAKFRYIIARWGYSPAIMAWEVFNEVEYTDAFEKDLDAVAAWHAEMAAFLRQQDPYHHLITTSSKVSEPKLWPAMDYYQAHAYPPDIIAAAAALDAENLPRAYFNGEIGSAAVVSMEGAANARGESIHQAIWSSLMSGSSGAAQCWAWESIEPGELYQYTAARKFIDQSGILDHPQARPIAVSVQTTERVPLKFSSGVGWESSKGTEFTIRPTGIVEGVAGMSAYLQGDKNRPMFPFAVFHVDYPKAGTFSVRLDEMTPKGAHLVASVDGSEVSALNLEAPPQLGPPGRAAPAGGQGGPVRNVRLDATLELPLSVGVHTVRLENTGPEWVHIREMELSEYAPALAVLAKGDAESAVLWVYRRESTPAQPISGTLSIPGLSGGAYKAVWWDTAKGQVIKEQAMQVNPGQPAILATPPIVGGISLWIKR